MVQEALTNVLRYAKARNVWVSLEHTGSGLALVLRDDGVGIAPQALAHRLSHGIVGMRNVSPRWVETSASGASLVAARPSKSSSRLAVATPLPPVPDPLRRPSPRSRERSAAGVLGTDVIPAHAGLRKE